MTENSYKSLRVGPDSGSTLWVSGSQGWTTITGDGADRRQTVTLGQTIGRRVIERGFNGTNGLTIVATGLRFRCTAAFPAGTTEAYLKSFSAHKMKPPGGWPAPAPKPFDCEAFNCTCQGMADFYGVGASRGSFGCAPPAAQEWWQKQHKPCAQPGYSCCSAASYTKNHAPFPGCKHIN